MKKTATLLILALCSLPLLSQNNETLLNLNSGISFANKKETTTYQLGIGYKNEIKENLHFRLDLGLRGMDNKRVIEHRFGVDTKHFYYFGFVQVVFQGKTETKVNNNVGLGLHYKLDVGNNYTVELGIQQSVFEYTKNRRVTLLQVGLTKGF